MRKRTGNGRKCFIEFHRTYLMVALGFVLTGYYLNLIVFTLLILVHELGHFMMGKVFGVGVKKIIVYPYGGMTIFSDFVNRDIQEELLIAAAGVIMQFFFYLMISFGHDLGYIRDYTMNLYTMYSNQMIFFNLMPIYPLDGGKILYLLLCKVFCYSWANVLIVILSGLGLGILLLLNIYCCNYSNVMIMGVLLVYLFEFFRKRKYLYQRFLLERYLYSITYPKIKVVDRVEKMYKNRTHLFFLKKGYISEKDMLNRLFRSKY